MGVTRQSWGDITLHYTQANIVIKRDSRDPLFSELTIINVYRLNKTSYISIMWATIFLNNKQFHLFIENMYNTKKCGLII